MKWITIDGGDIPSWKIWMILAMPNKGREMWQKGAKQLKFMAKLER